MTAADAKAQLQARLLEHVRYLRVLEGWYVNELVGQLGNVFRDEEIEAWVCEVLQPMGTPGTNACMWVERVNAEVSR